MFVKEFNIKDEIVEFIRVLKQGTVAVIETNKDFTHEVFKSYRDYGKLDKKFKEVYGYIFSLQEEITLDDMPAPPIATHIKRIVNAIIDKLVSTLDDLADIGDCGLGNNATDVISKEIFRIKLREAFEITECDSKISDFADYVITESYLTAMFDTDEYKDKKEKNKNIGDKLKESLKHVSVFLMLLRNVHNRKNKKTLAKEVNFLKEDLLSCSNVYLKNLEMWMDTVENLEEVSIDPYKSLEKIKDALNNFNIIKDLGNLTAIVSILGKKTYHLFNEMIEEKGRLDDDFFVLMNELMVHVYTVLLGIDLDKDKDSMTGICSLMNSYLLSNISSFYDIEIDKSDRWEVIQEINGIIYQHFVLLLICYEKYKMQLH